jgi:PiT family inorganic phosphate transporter
VTAAVFGAVVLLAAVFAFVNGFRDVSTSVALAVRTRALTPSVAVLLAAFFNFLGALVSAGLAVAVSQTWIRLPDGTDGLSILLAGLASAIAWGILLWWRGRPPGHGWRRRGCPATTKGCPRRWRWPGRRGGC